MLHRMLQVSSEAVKVAAEYAEKNELGWKSRAIFELATEAVVKKALRVDDKPAASPSPPPPPPPAAEKKNGPFGGLFGK